MKKLLALFFLIVSGFISYVEADVTAPSGRFLQIRQTLQPSSTVYFSSGTVQTYLSVDGIMSLPHSAVPPVADCGSEIQRGRVYIDTNSVSGQQIYVCEGTLGWIAQAGGGGGGGGTTILVEDGGSSIVNTSTINFTGDTFVVTNSGGEGLVALNFSSITSRSDVILNQNSLQSGATFFVSSGTVNGQLSVLQIKFPDGTIQVSSPTVGVGSTPAGSNTNVQFNDNGAFGGVQNFLFDKSSNTLTILGSHSSTKLPVIILSTTPASSSPNAAMAWQFRDFAGSTQTVFLVDASQSSADTSTSTLVSLKIVGDNVLDTVMRLGEPSGSSVPYVDLPTAGTRLQFNSGGSGTAYIEANQTTGDLTFSPTSSASRFRFSGNPATAVLFLFDTSSNDGDISWSGPNDVFTVSDDWQLQAQNELRFADSDSSNYVGFKSSAIVPSNVIWTLPPADGTSGQAVTTNGSGVLSFTTITGGGPVTLSTMTAGATNFIFNQDILQSGATFYVSSGTVQGLFSVVNADTSFPGIEIFTPMGTSASTFLALTNTSARSAGNRSTLSLRALARGPGFDYQEDMGIIRSEVIDSDFTETASRLDFNVASGGGSGSGTDPTFSLVGNNLSGEKARLDHYNGTEYRYYDSDNSNYVGFKSSAVLTSDNIYTWMKSSGTAGQAIVTDGNNNLYFTTISGGGGSGTTIEVESDGASVVNTSTVNFTLGLSASNDSGEAKAVLNPSSFIGNQSWSDGVADTVITVAYNINGGVPPEWTYSDNQIDTINNISLSALDPSQPLQLNGTAIVISDPINLSDNVNQVTGQLPGANLGSGSTNYIQNRNTLQSGATFYVSSGTVGGQFNILPTSTGRATTVIPQGNIGVSGGATSSAVGAGAMYDVSNSTSLGVVVFNNQAQTVGSANSLMTVLSTNTGYGGYFMRFFRNDSNSNGEIRFDSPNPNLEFVETDQVSPAGKFEIGINSGVSYIATRNSADDSFERIAEFRSKLNSNNGVIVKSTGSLFLEDSVGSTLGFKAPNTLGGSWTHTLWNTSDNTGKLLVQTTASGTRDLNWSKTIGKAGDDIIFSSNVILGGGQTTFYHNAPAVVSSVTVQNRLSSLATYPTPPMVVVSSAMVGNFNAHYVSSHTIGTSGATIPLLNGVNTWSNLQNFTGGAYVSGGNLLSVESPSYVEFLNQSDQPLIYFQGPNTFQILGLTNDFASQSEDNLSFYNIGTSQPIASFFGDRIQHYMDTYLTSLVSFSNKVIYTSTTSTLSADTNNFDWGNQTYVRLNITTPLTITGVTSPGGNAIKYVCNVGTNPVVFANESASSSAANRIATGTGTNFVLSSSNTVTAIYDGIASRWRLW